ncbi:MAG: hypothetical protein HY879_09695 [Deltaproteobacteria bacterium]|nr:hypothetical protein [Deltaproteobacteria bacterium]
MSACRYHPEREGVFPCQKHQIYYCQDCFGQGVSCTDPNLFCKFRPQCLINESEKEREEEKKILPSKLKAEGSGE